MSFARHRAALEALAHRGRLRGLAPAAGLDFASNDYLGLAGSALLAKAAAEALARGVPPGAGGSRLLRGNHPEHEALEAEAAAFFGAEAALFMGGGFQANQAIFSTLPMRGDLVLHDALIHASAHEGMRLGRAETRAFAHNDAADAARAIAAWRGAGGAGRVWIAVESVYSMQGDLAPLADLAALALREDAVLVVDEAHATGVFGPQGRGLAQGLGCDLVTLHTGGKALGVSGALVCADRVLVETLVNRARPFVYATAPAPLTAALLRAALRALAGTNLTGQAQARIAAARAAAARLGIAAESQIVPVLLGDDRLALEQAARLRARGFDVRAIRPPTVPKGTARLRISVTGNVGSDDIAALFRALA
ncbi:8-amino-7-oxononanoate synthase [Paracoccus aminovorans]|uniref:8-amino-7-oxononanoate synthase n=1 Tax=Paracoccus aminovorans TaxID=34004 RepID=A0A1I2Z5K2_9RHOB|nr:aminotransferase class I/II-fold pyridoxal phosphate-dependent enzyme [Paracoccus aminovorans]CQR83950.1 8-amino-7-oxononanoate synthase [Paracoccus aminovorans]SFH32301.1 8-amino-7-oxononanoate synthase [Paracoccus aminovorans]